MKTALLIGCGSKFGLTLLKNLLDQNWTIYSISGTSVDIQSHNLYQKIVDWDNFNVGIIEKFLKNCPKMDLIFFNQNSSALDKDYFTKNYYSTLELWKQEKTWSQSYFVSCILPFHIIHSLGDRCDNNTKVGWMLSTYIYNHTNISNADYIGNKYQNYLIMKNFSQVHPSCFIGINPDTLSETGTIDNIKKLITFIENATTVISGKVIKFDASEDDNFQQFIN